MPLGRLLYQCFHLAFLAHVGRHEPCVGLLDQFLSNSLSLLPVLPPTGATGAEQNKLFLSLFGCPTTCCNLTPMTAKPSLSDEWVDKAIDQGIAYLFHHQYPNGEFCCYIAADEMMQDWTLADSTIFPTALIATSLLSLAGESRVEHILNRTLPFFQYQTMTGGSWHHFTHLHPLRQYSPADIDDTVYVSNFIKQRGGAVPNNRALVLANRNPAGLFYTWFVLRPHWRRSRAYWRLAVKELTHPLNSILFWLKTESERSDIDGVVNANVLYYLGDCDATQPAIRFLLAIIANQQEADCDKWYRRPFSVYYFMSRCYQAGIQKLEPAREAIIGRILAKAQASGQLGDTVLDTALGLIALLNWNAGESSELDGAARFLVQQQFYTGEWPRVLFYYGGPKKLQGWGSEELTTGFCLEALALYRQRSRRPKRTAPGATYNS